MSTPEEKKHDLRELGQTLTQTMSDMLAMLHPTDAGYMLIAMFSGVVGIMTEERWEAVKKGLREPCNMPDCDCHTHIIPILVSLDAMREDYITQTADIIGDQPPS